MKTKRSVVLKDEVKAFIEQTAEKDGREFSAQLNILIEEARAARAARAQQVAA